jgi:predicted HicB family RNase H-like nuclease
MITERNLTIQLDESTVKKARVVAARRSISISRLVSEEIEEAAKNSFGSTRTTFSLRRQTLA